MYNIQFHEFWNTIMKRISSRIFKINFEPNPDLFLVIKHEEVENK